MKEGNGREKEISLNDDFNACEPLPFPSGYSINPGKVLSAIGKKVVFLEDIRDATGEIIAYKNETAEITDARVLDTREWDLSFYDGLSWRTKDEVKSLPPAERKAELAKSHLKRWKDTAYTASFFFIFADDCFIYKSDRGIKWEFIKERKKGNKNK